MGYSSLYAPTAGAFTGKSEPPSRSRHAHENYFETVSQ
jgi:hypothetical protein